MHVYLIWQLVFDIGQLVLGNGFLYYLGQSVLLGSTGAFRSNTPASSQYYTSQLQVHLCFHFQLSFLLPVLVLTRAHQSCSVLARDAMFYYIVLEYSMYSIWMVLTITDNPLSLSLVPQSQPQSRVSASVPFSFSFSFSSSYSCND